MKLTRNNPGVHLAGAVMLAVCATLPARADYQSSITNQHPVGYWRLDETTLPPNSISAINQGSLGTAANANYNNYPTRGQTGPFTDSVAVGLDGLTQTITTPWQPALNPTNAFSVELWVNPARVPNFAYVASSVHISSPRAGWYLAQDNNSTFQLGNGFVVRFFYQTGSTPSITLFATNDLPVGSWYHLVLTYDGTTATLYKNGVVAQSGTPTGYIGNFDSQLSLGCRSDNGFPWPGKMAEAAFYTSALSAAQVATHYTTATTTPANYAATVQGNSPVVYYRFRETPDPVSANLGTKGAAANAIYVYNATPGGVGPTPPTYAGFEAANKAVAIETNIGGAVRIPALNLNTNTVTMTAWVKPNGPQNPSAGIVFSRAGATVSGLNIDGYGGFGIGYTWNNDAGSYNWYPTTDSGLPSLQDGAWNYIALAVTPTVATVYIANTTDPAGFSSAVNLNLTTHPNQAFEGATLLGRDGGFTNRYFNGLIDEVTIFNRTLATGEIYSQFAAALGNVPAKIFADPQSPASTVYDGDKVNLFVDAGGTPPLTYQWRHNNTALIGETNSTLSLTNIQLTQSGSYDVVVQAATGPAVTSLPASISVTALVAPSISQDPVGRTLYKGGTLSLSVTAAGGQLSYYWLKDGSFVSLSTSSNFVINTVDTTNSGSYSVVVSNRVATATSAAAVVTVRAGAAGTYEEAVLADAPRSWWRLDETSGTILFDGMGHNDGAYTNFSYTLNAAGIIASDKAVSADGSDEYFAFVPFNADLANTDFTLECWAKVSDTSASYCPISFYEQSKKGEFYYADPAAGWRAAIGAGSDPYAFYYLGDTPGATVVADKWTHVAITYNASTGLRCYVNGQWNGSAYGNFPRNTTGALKFGGVGPSINYKFKGTVDDVAFYKTALSQARLQAHYVTALYGTTTAPVFTIQPVSKAVQVGANVTFTGFADGSIPIGYQWMRDGVPLAGKTTTALALNNVQFTDIATYQLQATNPAGTTLSAPATLVISPLPAFANATNDLVLHLRFDGDYLDSSGRGNNATAQGAPTIVAGKLGSGALHYSTDTAAATYNYISLAKPTDLLFSSNVNFTVGYWVRLPAGYARGDLPFLCSANNSYGGIGLTFAPTYGTAAGGSTSGGWSWFVRGVADQGVGIYGPAATINDGNWHHLLHSFTRTGNAVTFLDGAQVDSRSITSVGDVDAGNTFNIGQDPSGAYAETGSGDLDDMAVWRRALTATDAAAIYYIGQNFGRSFDTYGPVTVYLSKAATGYVLVWQAGTLLQADSPTGPPQSWTPVPGASAPNYRLTPAATGTKYYKVKL